MYVPPTAKGACGPGIGPVQDPTARARAVSAGPRYSAAETSAAGADSAGVDACWAAGAAAGTGVFSLYQVANSSGDFTSRVDRMTPCPEPQSWPHTMSQAPTFCGVNHTWASVPGMASWAMRMGTSARLWITSLAVTPTIAFCPSGRVRG